MKKVNRTRPAVINSDSRLEFMTDQLRERQSELKKLQDEHEKILFRYAMLEKENADLKDALRIMRDAWSSVKSIYEDSVNYKVKYEIMQDRQRGFVEEMDRLREVMQAQKRELDEIKKHAGGAGTG